MSYTLTQIGGLCALSAITLSITGLYIWHVVTYKQRTERKAMMRLLVMNGGVS